MIKITRTQRSVYTFMFDFFRDNHAMPTNREIADHFGWRSPNAANDNVAVLARKGYIEKRGSKYKFTKFEVQLTPKGKDHE